MINRLAFTVISFLLVSAAIAEEPRPAIKAKTMTAHWSCHAYSQMMKDEEKYERHFEAGLRDGVDFMNAVKNNQVSDDEFRTEVPWIVGINLHGPSSEFILGRLYELIVRNASDRVTRKADFGPEMLQHDTDEELLAVKAGNKYDQANCDILN